MLTPEQFVATYSNFHLKETAAYASHFDDLCRLVNHARPVEQDKIGVSFTYQKGVQKGGTRTQGYADVWYKGYFGWEYKTAGKHKTLEAAYQQLLLYKDALENPPLLVVCDFDRYEIHTNFQNAVTRVYRFTHADIASPKPVEGARFTAYEILHKLFHDPEALRPAETPDDVTDKAARQFAQLADSMHKYKIPPARVARFVTKLVFCLFAEDVGLLPGDIFERIVKATQGKPREFVRQLGELFEAMATGGRMVWDVTVPYFNGGLFDAGVGLDVVELDGVDLDLLRAACQLNWADVNPTIFGTLFERALDIEGKRAQFGAHYTSRADIETLLEPVLMAPLRREWGMVKSQCADYLDWQSETRPKQKDKKKTALEKLLRDFQTRLTQTVVLDPACGSGNFLYVALTLLKDLEKQVITFGLDVGLPDLTPQVAPAQLRGIEKDDFAFQLASVVVWIGYLQWKVKNGYSPASEVPILKPLNSIQQMDAIINLSPRPPSLTGKGEKHSSANSHLSRPGRSSADSHPSPAQGEGPGIGVEPVWPAATVIVGNPPFLGGNKIRAELGDVYVDALFELYKGRVPAFSDLCCYWFEKARAQIAAWQAERVGLLATQGIRGGVNREVLKRIKETGDIFWAVSDREWFLDGAMVHISMVGFDGNIEKTRELDGHSVSIINPDLTAYADVTQAQQLNENLGLCFIGTKKAGAFDIEAGLARLWLNAPPNPNGTLNSDVIFKWANGKSLVSRVPQKWIINFGEMSQEEAAFYELPFRYAQENIYPERQTNNEERARVKWWQHRRPAVEMLQAVSKLPRYIATPRVSKHRLFVWLKPDILPDDGVYVFARDDDYFFGMLHSRLHEVWARAQGSQLREAESGFRYTPTTTFETFPCPWPPGQEPKKDPRVKAIAQAAQQLNQLRENWLDPYKDQPAALNMDLQKRTLTNLYNQKPQWLQDAQAALDRAVFAAYGWPDTLSDDEILEKLLAENLARVAAQR